LRTSLSAFFDVQIEHLQLSPLDIRLSHLEIVHGFPYHNRDPFDRLSIAQAMHEKVPILGPDPRFDDYGVEHVW
jgi:PIN domain nuclease of toxin-antitoxin system